MTTAKLRVESAAKSSCEPKKQTDVPEFDVTSGGFLHASLTTLLGSTAAKRQLEALELLSKLEKKK